MVFLLRLHGKMFHGVFQVAIFRNQDGSLNSARSEHAGVHLHPALWFVVFLLGHLVAPMDDLVSNGLLQELVRGEQDTNAPYHPSFRRPSLGSGSRQSSAVLAEASLSSLVRGRRFTEARGEKFGEPDQEKEMTQLATHLKQDLVDLTKDTITESLEGIISEVGDGEACDIKVNEEKKSGGAKSFLRGFWNSPSSQLKKLIRGSGGEKEELIVNELPPSTIPSVRNKQGKKRKQGRGRKRKLNDINNLLQKGEEITMEFEKKFMADSSRGPKESRGALVAEILTKISGRGKPTPVTTKSLKTLSAIMWKAGYKSSDMYLAEAKQMHVEHGHEWTQLLDFVYKKCKTGAARNRGPRKKAPEVPLKVREAKRKAILPCNVQVLFPKELFLFAMVWLLRSIELVEIKIQEVVFNKEKRTVELHWLKDKTDQAAMGKMRVLACRCTSKPCMPECPYFVSEDLVRKVTSRFTVAEYICYAKRKPSKRPTRSQIVNSWCTAYSQKVSGHSGRRSGALNYIRIGWSIPQVTYLGRWKSTLVYEYAQEALQETPVNHNFEVAKVNGTINVDADVKDSVENELKEQFAKLQIEVEEYKRDSRKAAKNLAKEIKDIAENYGSDKDQPPYVMSMGSKIIHQNLVPVTNTPALLWKTRCGWAFKDGGFCFVPTTEKVTCAKCLYYMDAQMQGGGNASNEGGFQL